MKKVLQQISKTRVAKVLVLAIFLISAGASNAQIGIGTAHPVASAQLEVSSTTKGFLPPRMTHTERNAIVSPVAGLMIWCSDCGISGEIQVFNGTAWTNLVGTAPISSIYIGSQVWMSTNLDVTSYKNGDPIPQVTNASVWNGLTEGAWCYYNFDPVNAIYGKLYNECAVRDPRGLAPLGWHIPSSAEWSTLTNYLGGQSVAGGKMKGKILWDSPNEGVTNESGFTGLPGGSVNSDGSFNSLGTVGRWWSTTESLIGNSSVVWILQLQNNFASSDLVPNENFIFTGGQDGVWIRMNIGFTIRCVRD